MISVVIPTLNRADLLSDALKSLTRQELAPDKFEVLVVDNGSTDHTKDVVRDWAARLANVRYLYEPEPGLHAGRHRGLCSSSGEILVFTDDDVEARPSWLQSISEAFADPEVAMVGGNNLPLFTQRPPRWLDRMWRRPQRDCVQSIPALSVLELGGSTREFSPFFVWGCNFSIRKDVLLDAGGFHPDGMPKALIAFRGDGETYVSRYVQTAGLKCIFSPGASVYHKVTPERMTYAYFRQRGFNQGVSDSYTFLRTPRDGLSVDPRRSLLKQIAGGAKAKLGQLIYLDREARGALHEFKLGYREGYAFHQQVYRDDPKLRDWVHKPSYFDKRKYCD